MDETRELPELGTKAAAVAAIESMLHAAIRLREPFSPLQLRYWLDAYYQARRAQEIEDEESSRTTEQQIDVHKLEEAILRWEHQRPHLIARVTYDGLRLSPDESSERDATPKPEDAAETQQTAEPPHQSPAATASPQGEAQSEAKPRQRPVGWTDGFEPVEPKREAPSSKAVAVFKREQFERLQRFLREGVSMQQIVKAAEGNITEDQILGIRECKRVPVAVYRVLEAALDRIETE